MIDHIEQFDIERARELINDDSEIRQFIGALAVAAKSEQPLTIGAGAVMGLLVELPQVADTLTAACSETERLTKERDALAAHVARLKEKARELLDSACPMGGEYPRNFMTVYAGDVKALRAALESQP